MRISLLISLILLLTMCSSYSADAYFYIAPAADKEVIKVGWYNQYSYMEKDNDDYIGFCKDYIDKITDYANYDYEIIEGDYNYLLDLLRAGEIDIIPLMFKFPKYQNEFYFANDTILTSLYLYTGESDSIEKVEMEELSGKVVGYYNEIHKQQLIEYTQSKMIKLNFLKYDSLAEVDEAIESGYVDLVLSDRVILNPNQILVDKISINELGLAVSKNRKDVLDRIDKALMDIKLENPYFTELLQEEYIKVKDVQFYLSTEEKEIIKKYNKLNIAIDNHGVYQYYNKKTMKFNGIDIDILDRISEMIGIEFEYISVDSKKLFDIGADLIGSVEENEKSIRNNGYKMTTPYLVMNLVSLRKANKDAKSISKGIYYKMNTLYENVESYIDIDYMFAELIRGRIDEIIITSLNADYIIRKNGLEGLSRIPITELSFRNCIAIRNDLPIELLSVFNRAIKSIKEAEIHDLIASDGRFNQRSFGSFIKENMKVFILTCLSIITIISIFFIIIIYGEKKHKKELLLLSKQEPLTKLLNRIAVESDIEQILSVKSDKSKYAFIIIDLDHFKEINDTYGHAIGDAVIIHFSLFLTKFFSSEGMVSRIGGDEFIVFMKIPNEKVLKYRMEKFFYSNELEVEIDKIDLKISTSIGISIYPENGQNFNELYKIADEALYHVKNTGKANYKIAENSKRLDNLIM